MESKEARSAIYHYKVKHGLRNRAGRKEKNILDKKSQVVISKTNQFFYELGVKEFPLQVMTHEEAIKVGKSVFKQLNEIDNE